MSQFITMFFAFAPVISIVGVGVIVRWIGWLTESADKTLLSLTIRLLLPCLTVRAVMTGDWFHSSRDLWLPPLVGGGLTLLGFAIGGLVAWLMGPKLGLRTTPQRCTFVLCVGLFNYGHLPIPLISEIFPGDTSTLATLLIHNVGVEIVLWTVGLTLLAGKLEKQWWRGVFNPIVVAILASVTLKLSVPAMLNEEALRLLVLAVRPLGSMISMLADSAIPLSLLLTGATIADVWRQADFRRGWPVTMASCLLRLGVLPALFLAVAMLPLGGPLQRVVVVQAAMPAALIPIVLARHYGGDAPTAVRVVIATQVMSVLTAPLWLWATHAALW